jgi:hypothetical protein
MEPGYQAKHERVYRMRGKAREQICVTCGQPARHWAQIHGTDGSDPMADYQPMCHRCHFAYDDVAERSAQKRRGRTQSPEWIERRTTPLRGNLRSHNKSGVPGVHWHTENEVWRVQVRRVNGGCWPVFADAVAARNKLALKLYGPDAKVYDVPPERK